MTCSYAKDLFDNLALDPRSPEHAVIRATEYGELVPNAINAIVGVSDQNGDNAVDFEEFFFKLKDYVSIIFGVLDEDKDGSLFAEASTGNIGQKFTLHFLRRP